MVANHPGMTGTVLELGPTCWLYPGLRTNIPEHSLITQAAVWQKNMEYSY